jgi:predicted protein tyrosine phosphatase
MSDTAPQRVLFVCRQNRSRSATAERLFCKRTDLDVRSAGTAADALVRVNANMLEWADVIFIMDDDQRQWLETTFEGHAALSRIVCLEIPDDFTFLQAELVELLESRVPLHLNRTGNASTGD